MSREAATPLPPTRLDPPRGDPRQLRALVEAWDGVDGFHRNVIADWLEEAGRAWAAERVRKMGAPPRFPGGREITEFVARFLARAAGFRLAPAALAAQPHIWPAGQLTLDYLGTPSRSVTHLCPARNEPLVATALGDVPLDSAFVLTHTPLRKFAYRRPPLPDELCAMLPNPQSPFGPTPFVSFLAGQCETCPKAWWHWEQWEEVRTRQRRGYILGLRE